MSLNSQRIIQHRPEREEKLKNKLLAETKRENQILKRKLSREYKRREQLETILDAMGVDYSMEETPEEKKPEEPFVPPTQPEKPKEGCPECGGHIRVVSVAGKDFVVCEDCLWRKPVPVISIS